MQQTTPVSNAVSRLSNYLQHESQAQGGDRDTLVLNKKDKEFFSNYIINPVPFPPNIPVISHAAIKSAADTVDRWINAKAESFDSESDLISYLLEWWAYVNLNVALLKITCTDRDLGNTLFRSINARGKNLAAVDLIKNDILQLTDDDESTVLIWETAIDPFRNITGANAEDFLRHQWIARKSDVRLNALHSRISNTIRSVSDAQTYLLSLAEDANLYAAVTDVSHSTWSQVLGSRLQDPYLRWALKVIIDDLGHRQIRPLLMICLEKLRSNPDELEQFIRKFVGWSIRGSITRSWTRIAMEATVATACVELRDCDTISTEQIYVLINPPLKPTIFNDEQFSGALTNSVFASKSAKLLLGGIENYRRKTELGDSDIPKWQDISPLWVEHIMPRSPTIPAWPSAFDENGTQTVNSVFKARTLGSLTLLSGKRNIQASNRAFQNKKETYGGSDLLIVKELASSPDWTLAEIDDRQQSLNRIACEAWPG
jgi:hypothetical protein